MEIILKFHKKTEETDQLTLQDSLFSMACGYSFHHQENIQIKSQTLTSISSHQNANLIQNIKQAYQAHKIDEAFKLVNQYESKNESEGQKLSTENKKLFSQIKQQMIDVLNYEKQMLPEGWVQKKKSNKYKVSTKQFDTTVGVLIEADLDLPIQKLLFIVNEFDLMKDVMPFMESSKQLKKIARNNKIGHLIQDFPILSKRQAFFQGMGYDRLDHNKTMFLCSRSLHNRPDLQQKLDYKVVPTKGAVQLQYKFFLIEYQPYTKENGHIKLAMNIDMQVSVPMFLMDPVTCNFGKDFFKSLLKIVKNFKGSEWEKRLEHKKQFTDYITSTINSYFSEQKEAQRKQIKEKQ